MENIIWKKFNEVEIETGKKYVGIRNGKRYNKNSKSWFKHDAIWFRKKDDSDYLWNSDDFLYNEGPNFLHHMKPDVLDYYCEYPDIMSDSWMSGMPTDDFIKFGRLYFVKVNVGETRKVLLCKMTQTCAYGDSFCVHGKYIPPYYVLSSIDPKDVASWMPLPKVPEDVDASGLFKYNDTFHNQ